VVKKVGSISRRIVVATAVVLTVAAGLPTIAGFFGRAAWTFELATSFRPQYLAVLAVTALLLTLLARPVAAGAAALLLIVNVGFVAPVSVDVPVEAAAGSATLRVVFHNTNGHGEERYDEIAASVAAADADLVVFAHITPEGARQVQRALGAPYEVALPRELHGRALIILTRVPLLGAETVLLTEDARFDSAVLEVSLGGQTVRLLAVHTYSPRTPSRADVRDRELAAIGRWAKVQTGPTLVVGDLNTTPWSRAFRALERDAGLRNSQRGFGLQATWPAGYGPLRVPIDHVLHSRHLATVHRAVGPAHGATHHSLLVEIAPAVAPRR
jgi:endonuclease/exonuclease/phosphatase (EEP) superfamily protein YafD